MSTRPWADPVLNAEREKELIERLRQAVGKGQLIINAAEITSTSQDAVTRVSDGFQELVNRTYTNLSLLGGKVYTEQQVAAVVQNDQGLFTAGSLSALNSPGAEVESWVISQTKLGELITVKKIVDRFESKPYGWDLGSIEVVLAWLVGNGKIALTIDANPVARTEAAAIIRNTSRHQHTVVAPQKAYDATKVARFRTFCIDFFDDGAAPSDATELARFGKDKLAKKRDELNALVTTSRYAFVTQLADVVTLLDRVAGKHVDWYLNDFDKADELIEAKEDLIDPIKSFLNGQQAKIFDEASALLGANTGNLGYLPAGSAAPVEALLADANAFRGAKMNQLKVATETLRDLLESRILGARQQVKSELEARLAALLEQSVYKGASQEAQDAVRSRVDAIFTSLESQNLIAVIEQTGSHFKENDYPSLIDQLTKSADPAEPQKPAVSFGTLKVVGAPALIETEPEMERYLSALRSVLLQTINDGKRITL